MYVIYVIYVMYVMYVCMYACMYVCMYSMSVCMYVYIYDSLGKNFQWELSILQQLNTNAIETRTTSVKRGQLLWSVENFCEA